MINTQYIDEIASKISALLRDSPAAEIEKNLRALLQGLFTKMELVTREEFDVQCQVLLRTREQLQRLEQQLAEIEARQPRESSPKE